MRTGLVERMGENLGLIRGFGNQGVPWREDGLGLMGVMGKA